MFSFLLLSRWQSILAQGIAGGDQWGRGAGVRCSANFVEGKGRETTYKLQSLKRSVDCQKRSIKYFFTETEVWFGLSHCAVKYPVRLEGSGAAQSDFSL